MRRSAEENNASGAANGAGVGIDDDGTAGRAHSNITEVEIFPLENRERVKDRGFRRGILIRCDRGGVRRRKRAQREQRRGKAAEEKDATIWRLALQG